MSDLNLLPNVAKFQASKIQLKNQAKKVSIGVSIGWLSSVILILGVWYYFNTRLESEQQRYDYSIKDYESLQKEIQLNQVMKAKAKIVGEILAERFEYSEVYKLVKGLFSENIKLEKTQLDNNSSIKLSGSAKNLSSLREVESKVKDAKQGLIEGVSDMKLYNLSYSDGWKFDLEVSLK